MRTILIILMFMGLFSLQAMANETDEKMYLIQILNQLDAIKPLIISAHQEQEKNTRVKFHYMAYRDSNGTLHNGLLEDINAIQKGIQEKLKDTVSEPRHFQAIKGDYLNLKDIKANIAGMEVNHVK